MRIQHWCRSQRKSSSHPLLGQLEALLLSSCGGFCLMWQSGVSFMLHIDEGLRLRCHEISATYCRVPLETNLPQCAPWDYDYHTAKEEEHHNKYNTTTLEEIYTMGSWWTRLDVHTKLSIAQRLTAPPTSPGPNLCMRQPRLYSVQLNLTSDTSTRVLLQDWLAFWHQFLSLKIFAFDMRYFTCCSTDIYESVVHQVL
jgi:hypothetical protein